MEHGVGFPVPVRGVSAKKSKHNGCGYHMGTHRIAKQKREKIYPISKENDNMNTEETAQEWQPAKL